MSMIGKYRRLTLQQLDELKEGLRADPNAVAEYLYPEDRSFDKPDPDLEIGKSWHGIHYLLDKNFTAASLPIPDVVFGGLEIGRK